MKSIFLALILTFGLVSVSFAGNCHNVQQQVVQHHNNVQLVERVRFVEVPQVERVVVRERIVVEKVVNDHHNTQQQNVGRGSVNVNVNSRRGFFRR